MTSILKSCLVPNCSSTMDTTVGMPTGRGGRAFDDMKAHVQKNVSFDLSKNTFADDYTEYTYESTVYNSDSISSESSFGSYDCGAMMYSTAAHVVATTTTAAAKIETQPPVMTRARTAPVKSVETSDLDMIQSCNSMRDRFESASTHKRFGISPSSPPLDDPPLDENVEMKYATFQNGNKKRSFLSKREIAKRTLQTLKFQNKKKSSTSTATTAATKQDPPSAKVSSSQKIEKEEPKMNKAQKRNALAKQILARRKLIAVKSSSSQEGETQVVKEQSPSPSGKLEP